MKVFILVVCAFAAASAGWAPVGYHGPQHVPVIHNGVPLETPEVQHAKAAHYAAVSEAQSRADYQHYEDNSNYGGYDSTGYSQAISHGPSQHYTTGVITKPAYQTSHVQPAIGHDGKPLDTPEVEAAKAHHFAAVQKALIQTSSQGVQHHYRKRRGLYSDHESNGYSIQQIHAPVYGGQHGYHQDEFQGVDDHGHPLDTPEVAHAKALHEYAHHEAIARNSQHGHVPQPGPVDTIEVQYEKIKHFTAYEEAKALNELAKQGYEVAHKDAPVDTPEVQHAKAEHLAAHAAASAQHQEQQYHHY